ncbi:14509_t:CDS:2 [Entrophospora sp. SA101]|nr:14509_t:CDS:2 [Entrophospora sp. SA101]
MFTELAIPRGFREAWEQAKKVESTLRKDNPFNNDNLQHINTLVANQVTQLGQNVNALAMEIREVAVVQREQLSQQQGRNYQQRTNNNQQQPRRVLLNQEYYKEQQEPQYYTEYQPQMSKFTPGGALEEKKAPDKKIDAITSKVLINNIETEVVIDTGSGLSGGIDQEFYSQLIDVNGNKTRPLGIAKGILVTLNGKRPINIDMKILEAKENGKAIQYPILFEKEPKEVILEGNELYEDEVLQEEAAYFEAPVLTIKGESNLTPKQEQQLDKFISEYKDRPYRDDREKRTFIREEESNNTWTSPVIVVKKKNGKLRLCVDYKKLNEKTKQDEYPLPMINVIFDTMVGAKWFTMLDCMSRYWQMKVTEEDQEKTAFITEDGLYEFTVMPFGLTNVPAAFQRMMD